ncbi:hypothetical protein NUU61_003408 [Penicillium alfredii]|uniref:F-box domain-containing protein n=1 Tax=Penicillium alfredii TaxID=1506179 RepID=A0A9W9FTA7_9EURO|nr:uncharacterized protein NUU61_003408 [Penicillium alfredii]KAJ5106061.1 hypothetical protein NUU61_003408 [Penicillium alfredii]
MSPQLDSLPFDVFYQIANSLDDCDAISLSRTNRSLHSLMDSDLIARKTVENILRYSKEGQSALAAQSGYRKAVGHRVAIHEAVATAAPYAVSVLAYGADFLYHQGYLCYRVGQEIRLLDVHHGRRVERVLNLCEVHPRLLDGQPGTDQKVRVSLLHYADDILVFRVSGLTHDDSLLAIDMEPRSDHLRRRRLLLQRSLPAAAPIFVRHSRSYIWYGTFTAVDGSDGVWSVCGVDLATMQSIEFPLDRVVDGDLGQTLCFEMHQDHLYAVSTQVASDEDEELSSFYHWLCHAPRHRSQKWSGRLWRREHREGPINEMWTDLSIRTDEATGRPVILECRREWRHGRSENHRTYYTQPLPVPQEAWAAPSDAVGNCPPREQVNHNPKDSVAARRPYDQWPEKRLRRHYHAEYEPGADTAPRQEFIAARTKHRNYHLAASTFLDLVNDPAPHADGVRSHDRLRLRTVSRKRKCPIDEEGAEGPRGLLFQPTQFGSDGRPVEGSEERFDSRGVCLWPPDDAPPALHHLLCPDSRTASICAVSDERSLIYSVPSPGVPKDHQALILISFDPSLHLPTLNSLSSLDTANEPPSPPTPPPPYTFSRDVVREAPAYYLTIQHGYRLR